MAKMRVLIPIVLSLMFLACKGAERQESISLSPNSKPLLTTSSSGQRGRPRIIIKANPYLGGMIPYRLTQCKVWIGKSFIGVVHPCQGGHRPRVKRNPEDNEAVFNAMAKKAKDLYQGTTEQPGAIVIESDSAVSFDLILAVMEALKRQGMLTFEFVDHRMEEKLRNKQK